MKQFSEINPAVGEVVYLDRYRGMPRDQICRVVSVRNIKQLPVQLRSLVDNRITRSDKLIVILDMYDGQHYSVYDAFAWGSYARWYKRLYYYCVHLYYAHISK